MLLASVGASTQEVSAQETETGDDPELAAVEFRRDRPTALAQLLAAPPLLDGLVRDDPVWRELTPVDGFWQTRPFAGQPATERTEVRVGFTADTLYIGVVCFDRDPSRIIVSDARRDASLSETDSFQVIFDTYRDRQSGFVFGTNPAGIEYDGQVANEGSGGFGSGRFAGGSGGGFNLNWDGAWEVEAQITDYGWSAEMAIPFRTLRYPSGSEQLWGLNFQRNIRRHNEVSYWAELGRQFSLYRVSDAGTLTGLEVPPQRTFQLTPYVLGQARRPSSGPDDTDTDSEVGMDAKFGLTPSLTLDVTYNTDFAQVEVDEQQVNLDRFNLFFPEKRPFFLENAGQFAVGEPGLVDLFFSRRIGIIDGAQIPIDGGVRLSGKVSGLNVGFLGMRTASVGDEVPVNYYGVARVSREMANRSRVGAIFVNRDASGSVDPGDDDNRTYGIDGQLGIGEFHTLSGFAAQTDTPGIEGDEHAYRLEFSSSTPKWLTSASYTEVGEGFNPEVGFLARRGFQSPSAVALRRVRPENLLGFHELRPHVSYTAFWDFDGFQESEFLHIDNHWEWRNGHEIHTGINFTGEGVKTPFEIAEGVVVQPGEYSHSEAQLIYISDQGKPISFDSRLTAGGFFGGDRVAASGTLRVRRGEALTSELTWSHNNVNLPVGDFDVNLGRLRLSYAMSTRLLLQALVQYNDTTDRVTTNLRFSWLGAANTGLFVVYNEADDFGTRFPLERPDRSLIVKYSRLINVFGAR